MSNHANLIEVAITELIKKEPFFANLILNMTRTYTTDVPTLGVNVTDNVNLYVNPFFWKSMSLTEQVDVLKHECVAKNVLVKTDKGDITIGEIVENKLKVNVLSLSKKGKLEYKPVIGYSKKPIKDYPNKRWVSLKYAKSPYLYSSVVCTNDHKIAVTRDIFNPKIEYIEAEKAKNLYSIRKIDIDRQRNKERPLFNKDQLSVIIGCLLGDSCINSTGQFSSTGSKIHKDYIEYKHSILGGKIVNSWSDYKNEYSNLRINHGTNEQTKKLRELVYIKNKKNIKFLMKNLDTVALAFWFMDDGSWNNYGSSFFHTEGFSLEEQKLIVKTLKNKFGLRSEIKQRSGKPHLFNIKLKKEATNKLFALIAPYIHNSMKYKISEKYYNKLNSKKLNTNFLEFSAKKIISVKNKKFVRSQLYDITVADNHNFFANKTLVHNCYHVMMNHFHRFNFLEPNMLEKDKPLIDKIKSMFDANRLNRAADYAINEYLPNLPKKLQMFDKEGNVMRHPTEIMDKDGNKIPNPSLDAGKPMEGRPCLVEDLKKEIPRIEHRQNMEYYYEFLKQEESKDGNQSGGQGVIIIDDHSLWAEGNPDEEYVTEKVKSIINKSVEQSGGIGNLPGDILEAINRLNYKPKNWKQDLQRFVAKTAEIVIESSRKARNRRYGIIFPGTKVYPKLHLAVAIDESGSVDTECLNQFMAEVDRIHRDDVKITLIACDAKIQWIGEFDPKHKFEFKGRGGTAFKPVFDKCKDLEIDGLIYFTDGMNFEGNELKKPKYPVLWALLPNCKVQYDWGAKTKVEVQKRK